MTTTYHIADIRNIALAGHGASGKTSLADAMLYAAGATVRRGSVDDGTSLSDSEDEEKRRHFTIDCHPLHCEWSGKQVHLIDSPGEAAHRAIVHGLLVPIVCLSAKKDIGVREMLDLLADISLKPGEVHRFGHQSEGDAEVELSPIEEGELVAQVFKTTNDLFVGKLSVLRIHSGKLTHDTTLVNLRTGKTSKPGHIYRLQGKTQEEVKEAIAGDIVAIPKFDDLHISDTVTVAANGQSTPHLLLNPIRFPT